MQRRSLLHVVLLVSALNAWADDPFVGTWKLNPEKSRGRASYTPTATIESVDANSYRITIAATGTGKPFSFAVVLDGKEHPYEEGGTHVASRVNERHFVGTIKRANGSVTTDYEVSPDLKTLTVTRKGTGGTSGRKVDEVITFDK
jgi:hypothetical protein